MPKIKNERGRPSKEAVIQREYNRAEADIREKAPALFRKAIAKIEGILDNDKAKTSEILRAAEKSIEIYRACLAAERNKMNPQYEKKVGPVVEEKTKAAPLVSLYPQEVVND